MIQGKYVYVSALHLPRGTVCPLSSTLHLPSQLYNSCGIKMIVQTETMLGKNRLWCQTPWAQQGKAYFLCTALHGC